MERRELIAALVIALVVTIGWFITFRSAAAPVVDEPLTPAPEPPPMTWPCPIGSECKG